MVTSHKIKSRGALAGLAIGDALGAPTEGLSPSAIKQKWGRITDFLNKEQYGSDDTEYAIFSAELLLKYSETLTSALVAEAWRKEIIRSDNNYKGAGFSEMIAIRNLKEGLEPPYSGQHLHSWSDGLAMRAAPFGIVFAGNPARAAGYVRIDGEVSHSGEGIFGGQAVAAAVAEAMNDSSLEKIFDSALGVIPEDSWTYSSIMRAVEIGSNSVDVWSSLDELYGKIACSYYYWSDIAPEAVGLAFGLVAAAKGNFKEAVLGAVNIGRDTDTIAAIAGAITGALNGVESIPSDWRERITNAMGMCIASVKNKNILSVADSLSDLHEILIKTGRVS